MDWEAARRIDNIYKFIERELKELVEISEGSPSELAKYLKDAGASGIPGHPEYCPLANYLEERLVSEGSPLFDEDGTEIPHIVVLNGSVRVVAVPPGFEKPWRFVFLLDDKVLRNFVCRFDRGEYPELDSTQLQEQEV